jgi:dihydroorotate dehydrogenase
MGNSTATKSAGQPPAPRLNLIQKSMLLRGAIDSQYFNTTARPLLYRICNNDPETVHEFMIDNLRKHGDSIRSLSRLFFKPPENIRITFMGERMLPFGTAAGMDKNGDCLAAFENIFGFQEPGTIVVPQRGGNPRPRVAVLEDEKDILNAQGFPSRGLSNFIPALYDYRKAGGRAKIYVSVCGLPVSESNVVETAMSEMRVLIGTLKKDVDGFVWNPFSPNTAALKLLRDPVVFRETSKLMAEMAPDKLRLVKIGPYEQGEKSFAMGLVASFLDGGGHGVVTTNTKPIPKEQLPDSIRVSWGYPSAGRSGRSLEPYRLSSVRDIRMEFPQSVIIATGGIYTAAGAYYSFLAGANMLEGYTPYTYYGPGLLRKIMKGLSGALDERGMTLTDLQNEAKTLHR